METGNQLLTHAFLSIVTDGEPMNYEIMTLITAQNQTARYAREALPDSPIFADIGFGPRVGRIVRLRANLSVHLFALAGRISPATDYPSDRGPVFASSGKSATHAC